MSLDSLSRLWTQATQTQPAPPWWIVALTFALALALIIPRQVWPVTRNVVTIAHEGAHAFVALCCGRRLDGIRLHSDTSGVTISAGKPTGIGMVLTAAAGYVGPSLLGLGAAAVLNTGHATAMLLGVLVLLIAMLIMIRNAYGALIVLVVGALTYAVLAYTPPTVQSAFAYLLVWFLVLASPRPVRELQGHRKAGNAAESDADQLAALTGIPGFAWVVLFALITIAVIIQTALWIAF